MQNTFFIPFILIGGFFFGFVLGRLIRAAWAGRRPYYAYRENRGDLNQGNSDKTGKGG